MAMQSINPANGELLASFPLWNDARIDRALSTAAVAAPVWAALPLSQRCQSLRDVAAVLRQQRVALASLITLEMGKLRREAEAEIDKCALVCDYYAEQASAFLADELVASDAGKSLLAYEPLGAVLAIMPWNFPFWQVMRFAAPALAAGNVGLLKHAANVPQCAQALQQVFVAAGLPDGVFTTLMISSAQVAAVIEDPRVHAVTLTGSEQAGRQVAAVAGAALKKTVLELGGSDPFIVLADADLDAAVAAAVSSRFLNAGQSCIAAKRFIVVEAIADHFVAAFATAIQTLRCGDPGDPSTTLAPMARHDLRQELHQQVSDSIRLGAIAVTGCQLQVGDGAYYQPSLRDHVFAGMPAYEQELFGPVASILRVHDSDEAIAVANASDYGLGGSVWTATSDRGEALARRLQAGAVFVNGMVKSDPRLPFGGIKHSGYGRELSRLGLHEFLNIKTIWIR